MYVTLMPRLNATLKSLKAFIQLYSQYIIVYFYCNTRMDRQTNYYSALKCRTTDVNVEKNYHM